MAKSKLQPARRQPISSADIFIEETQNVIGPEPKKTAAKKPAAEPIKMVGFKFPLSKIDELKKLAGIAGMNSTQYLIKLISDDAEKKKDLLAVIAKNENLA